MKIFGTQDSRSRVFFQVKADLRNKKTSNKKWFGKN